jgi:hypothetical protein
MSEKTIEYLALAFLVMTIAAVVIAVAHAVAQTAKDSDNFYKTVFKHLREQSELTRYEETQTTDDPQPKGEQKREMKR